MKAPILIIYGCLIAVGIIPLIQSQKKVNPFGQHFWIVESCTISPALDLDLDGKPDKDVLIVVPDCERDDAEKYRMDGTIITNWGDLNCDEEEEDGEETGTWEYDEKNKLLTLSHFDTEKPTQAKIVQQSGNRIELESKHQSSKGMHTIRTIYRVKSS